MLSMSLLTDMIDRFHLFKPLSKTHNSFSTLKVQGLAFEEVTVVELMSSSLCSSATSSRIMAVIAISAGFVCFNLCQCIGNSSSNQCLKLSIGHSCGGGGCGGSLWCHYLQNRRSNKISLVLKFVLQR
ncbi:hypothetical protein Tco_1515384 [Tanacetum coccineum]